MSVSRAAAAVLASLALGASAASAQAPSEPDCAGPAGDPKPGTAAWDKREDDQVYCATQRVRDHASNPAYQQALVEQQASPWAGTAIDPFRQPSLWNGSRFRYEPISFTNAAGKRFSGYLFRPLRKVKAPYPGVVIMHGGAANQEMYFWGAEGLAEAGYMVLTFGIGRTDDTHYEDTRSALDYFTSKRNPRLAELDRRHVGLAGHSAGGVAVTRLGREGRRVSAIDPGDRAQSRPKSSG